MTDATQKDDHQVVVELLKELKSLKAEVAALKKAPTQSSGGSSKKSRAVPKDVAKLETKAAKIRALWIKGWSRGEIANALGIRFQHVYNTTNRVTRDFNPDQVKRK